MVDTTPLRHAFDALLQTADSLGTPLAGPPGEWGDEQILAHVCLVTATAAAVLSGIAAGTRPTYDSRLTQDSWTIGRVIALAGDRAGLGERLRRHGDALCALASTLSEAELDTAVPALLVSNGAVMLDQPLTPRDILTGLAGTELPGHDAQLRALRPVRESAGWSA
jgi:hypothetical protein